MPRNPRICSRSARAARLGRANRALACQGGRGRPGARKGRSPHHLTSHCEVCGPAPLGDLRALSRRRGAGLEHKGPASKKSSGRARKGGISALPNRCFSPARSAPRSRVIETWKYLEIAPPNSARGGVACLNPGFDYSEPAAGPALSNLNR